MPQFEVGRRPRRRLRRRRLYEACIPIVDGMSGEAPMDMGESMLDWGAAIHACVLQDSLVLSVQ